MLRDPLARTHSSRHLDYRNHSQQRVLAPSAAWTPRNSRQPPLPASSSCLRPAQREADTSDLSPPWAARVPHPRGATRNRLPATPPPDSAPPRHGNHPYPGRSQDISGLGGLPLLRIQRIHPIAISCTHRNDHMRTTVGTLVNHRHSHTHRPAPHIPLSPGHTTHPPGLHPERRLQPSRIPITTSRPRYELPAELQRIKERRHCLQAVHLITLITGTNWPDSPPAGTDTQTQPTHPPATGSVTPHTPDSAVCPASGDTASSGNGSPNDGPSGPSPPKNPSEPSPSV